MVAIKRFVGHRGAPSVVDGFTDAFHFVTSVLPFSYRISWWEMK